MDGLTSAEVFDTGHAIPAHDLELGVRHWRYRSEEYTLPWNAVTLTYIKGFKYLVGRIDEVRAAC